MKCPRCSSDIDEASIYCPYCGERISPDINYKTNTSTNTTPNYSRPNTSANTNNYNQQPQTIPSQYNPISAWGYVGYSLLFSIPLAGFILLIVFSFSDENINRRNYARSYFCMLLIGVIIFFIFGAALFGSLAQILGNL